MGPLRLWSFRQFLLGLHRDLFRIDNYSLPYVSREPLSQLEKLVLILEDRRYFNHFGVDVLAGMRELGRAITIQPHGGASTIAMQFVRTATGYKEVTISRKLYEMALAVLIQFRYLKIEILRSYLACAFFGSGLTGTESAALAHFNKQLSTLTIDEAAVIAAMLVYPRPLVPTPRWFAKVSRRANYAIRRYPRFEKCFDKIPGLESF
jgi:membrane peptidoglycan carboxypeptidase